MNIEKRGQLYEGKAKKVFETSDPNYLIVDYKDDATAFNGLKKGTIESKGIINNKVTNYLMKMLGEKGIPTHYVEEISCLLYTSPSPRDGLLSRMPSSA